MQVTNYLSLTDEIKIFNDKIKSSQSQYHLAGEAAKSFALSSTELHRYEYWTGEDLRNKPGVVEQAISKYSPLGKAFNK